MPGLYTITTRANGTTLTAAIYNADHQNHVDNEIPTMMDDYSSNVAQMQSAVDPGEVGAESLATSLAGELERLRFAIREMKGTTHWYETASNTLSGGFVTISGNTTLTSSAKGKTHNITAAAVIDLPAASTLNVGDIIKFKASTEQSMLIQRQGSDTIDGDTNYRPPAYSNVEVMKSGVGAYILTNRPLIDVGVIEPFGGTTAPRGWSLCDNNTLNRTNQGNLFAILSTTFGAGDGSTTFGKPDLRGRYPLGKDDMGGSAANRVTNAATSIQATVLGAVGGDQQMQAHQHTGTTSTNGNHTHQEFADGAADGSGSLLGVASNPGESAVSNVASQNTTGAAGDHNHTFTSDVTGGGSSQNMPPVLVTNYIIKL